jgi:isopenicillin N synthase-like dioxygenase
VKSLGHINTSVHDQLILSKSHSSKMAEAKTFDTLPILPLSHALDPATKPKFLEDLRHALLNVGFLYLSETGLPDQLIKDVIRECQGFFKELPQEEKERIEMKNQKSFLGWSRVSAILSYIATLHIDGRE